ncbi:MAG: thioredoxin family protein [Chloroflexi bacterium]|nr:thioredoxin family protein [Chloroflexota bacterium]
MFDRIVSATIIFALGIALYFVWTRGKLWRLRRGAASMRGLETREEGKPAILYFTSPDCIPCRTLQIPALERLISQARGALQIIKIDATLYPKTADSWGVLSVPTTFIIDHQGKPRRVNHGVTSAAKLRQQLREIGEWSSEFEMNAEEPSEINDDQILECNLN